MNYLGYYINLARSRARRAEIEAELERHGLLEQYTRIEAADGNTLKFPNPHLKEGEMGCFISHDLVLKKNLDQSKPMHIVEDDVLMSQHTRSVLDAVIAAELANFDIVFTETYVPLHIDFLKMYKSHYDRNVVRDRSGKIVGAKFDVLDMAGKPFAGATSYLVNGTSIRKLHNVYAKELAAGPRLPIDLFIRNKARDGVLKVGCVFPFVTSFRADPGSETTIGGRHDALSVFANNAVRHSFFVDAELSRCCDDVIQHLGASEGDPHHRLLAAVLGFCLTNKYRPI